MFEQAFQFELGCWMQNAKSSTLHACEASPVNVLMKATNSLLYCIGYHIASVAIRTKAMIMFKNKMLMLTRPPPPQYRSFFFWWNLCMVVDTQQSAIQTKQNVTTRFLHVSLHIHSQQVMHSAFDCVTHITFLCSCAF